MAMTSNEGQDARELVRRAEEVAAKLKPGTWEAVQALALLAIAKSLTTIAAANGPDRS